MPSFLIRSRYDWLSRSATYFSRRRRWPTKCNSPRRAARSLLWPFKWSVSSLMRSVAIAAWAAGLPVSVLCVCTALIAACFFSLVIMLSTFYQIAHRMTSAYIGGGKGVIGGGYGGGVVGPAAGAGADG